MAKRKNRGDAPIQRGFDFAVEPTGVQAVAPPRRRRVKRAPQVTVAVERLDTETLERAWNEANRSDCGSEEYRDRVSALRLAMLTGSFGVPNEPVAFDWHGRIINGRKLVKAAVDLGFPLRVPVVRGVDPRSRFAIDDAAPRNKQRNAGRSNPSKSFPKPLTLGRIPAAERADVGLLVDLIARTSAAERITGIRLPSAPEALASLDAARTAAGLTRLPLHLLAFVHMFAARHDAGRGPRDFMNALAIPLFDAGSAPTQLVRSDRRPPRVDDEVDFLATCVVAWGMFRAGKPGDPYLYRERLDPKPERAEILKAFLKGAQLVPVDADAIVWSVETFDRTEQEQELARSGRPVGSLTEEDSAKLTSLITDAIHADGLRHCGQSVKFRADGTIEDGISRFMASHAAEKPFRTVVARGFPAGWSSQAQKGRRQSYGHRNMSEGVSNPYDVSSAVKTIACYEADRRDIVIGLERHRIIHARYPTLMRYSILTRSIEKLVPGCASAAALAIIATRSRRHVEPFYQDILACYDGTLRPNSTRWRVTEALCRALRGAQRESVPLDDKERERRDSANHGRDRDQLMKFEWMLLAWNHWIHEREPPEFKEPVEERFVEVSYPPKAVE
jgi:hypothetical protein